MRALNWLLVLLLAVSVINYPNPFNPKGGQTVTFEATTDTNVSTFLYIYDMSARMLLRRAFDLQTGTTNRTTWDGYGNYNQMAGNGIYFYQIVESDGTRAAKGKIWVINQ
jgi:hypothetical protein